jgi:predicted nucleic acid-binding protein
MTRLPQPLRVSPDEAEAAITDLLNYLEPVPLVAEDYQQVIRVMAALRLTGGGIFDAVIAQAALKANVDQILTFNPKDFVRLGDAIEQMVRQPT